MLSEIKDNFEIDVKSQIIRIMIYKTVRDDAISGSLILINLLNANSTKYAITARLRSLSNMACQPITTTVLFNTDSAKIERLSTNAETDIKTVVLGGLFGLINVNQAKNPTLSAQSKINIRSIGPKFLVSLIKKPVFDSIVKQSCKKRRTKLTGNTIKKKSIILFCFIFILQTLNITQKHILNCITPYQKSQQKGETMKKMMLISVIISSFMFLMPLAVLGQVEKPKTEVIETAAVVKVENGRKDVFRVYDKTTDKTIEMAADDYIFCVVAAEMPALYEIEALKAQAVAAYTYACYKRELNKKADYDITTDFSTDQSFKTEEKACEDWGENAEEYVEKIKSAIKCVSGKCMYYENKPIFSAYHAVSSGKTYSAKDVWGKEIKYLKSVDSSGDKESKKYAAVLEFTESELEEKFSSLIEKKVENTDILSELKTKKSGLVDSVKVHGNDIAGSKIRTVLGLPSSNFKFEQKQGKYVFNCFGYGHGVGMSQHGANYMAKQGYTYKQILSHYYTSVTIK